MTDTGLVIFDCDGVLIDSEAISARMLIAELAGHGVTVTPEHVAATFLGRSYAVVLAEVRERFGIVLPDGFEATYRARLLAAFETELRVMPGVAAVIGALGVPCCVATSSSPARAHRSLALAGLAETFRGRVFTASEVARGKPAPDLFLHAAAKMGVAPEACLVIEDSLTGVRAARAAGIEVWRFLGGSHFAGLDTTEPGDAAPDRRFADFADFFDARATLRRQTAQVS